MKTEKHHIITLKTKLTPPRITNTIRRTRLESVFDALEKNRLIAVTAGAGHGKSTAAAQACRRLGYKSVWYRLDPSDRDLPVLVHYLVAGLIPHLKERTRQGLQFYSQSEDHHIREAAKFLLTIDAGKKAADLRILCFGAFELVKGDTQISSKAWVNHKARTLFKYLAFHSANGYIPRERLLELLWPEQDPAKTNNRLRVALSAIRKLLQPGLSRGKSSVYLLRREDAYRLHLGSNGYLDVTAFDRRLKEAESAEDPQQALAFFLKAESLYRGELFADEPYTQWCVELREIYKEKYVALLSRIVDLLDTGGEILRSIDYLERALAVDPYAETIYCRLMDLYIRSGNRFMAVKTYERCKRKIEIDLQCPVSSDTNNFYRQLLSNVWV